MNAIDMQFVKNEAENSNFTHLLPVYINILHHKKSSIAIISCCSICISEIFSTVSTLIV